MPQALERKRERIRRTALGSGDGSLGERVDGFGFVRLHIENSHEFCHFEQIQDLADGVEQFQSDAVIPSGCQRADELPHPDGLSQAQSAFQIEDGDVTALPDIAFHCHSRLPPAALFCEPRILAGKPENLIGEDDGS